MDRKQLKTYNNNIVKEGKSYFWGGSTSGLYTGYTWTRDLCKITNIDIEKKIITVYDYSENTEVEWSAENLQKGCVVFYNISLKSILGILN